MRWIIWLLLIFIIAIIAAFIATSTSGSTSVVFYMFDNSYKISFNAFVIALALAVGGLYFALRLIFGTIKLPSRTRKWNLLRKERYSHVKLNEATLQYFAGRYSRSLKNVTKALQNYEVKSLPLEDQKGAKEFCVLGNLLAAANENRLGNQENSIAQLQKAIANAKDSNLSEAPDGLQLLQIEWLINNNKPAEARAALQELDPGVSRRITALQMRLQLDRMENLPHSALQTVKLLAKHHAYAPDEARKVIVESACRVLGTTNNAQELQEAWGKLDKKDRNIPDVIAYTAKHYAILGDAQSARDLIASSWNAVGDMTPEVKHDFLSTLDTVLVGAGHSWLDRLEKAYNENPDDAMLTYLAGRTCYEQGITGRAQSLLEKAARHPALPLLLRQRAWFSIAQLAEKNGELAQANACYKEAVELLPN